MSTIATNKHHDHLARTGVIATGGLLWTFLVLIPIHHLDLWPHMSTANGVAAGLPLGVLALFTLWPERLLALTAFPLSHLPLFVTFPELMGARVYGGHAFLAVTLATVLFVIVGSRSSRPGKATAKPSERGTLTHAHQGMRLLWIHTITHTAIGASMVGALYFYRPFRLTLRAAYPHHEGVALISLGLLLFTIWGVLIARQLVSRLGTSMLAPQTHTLEWLRFTVECNAIDRARASLGWSILIAALSLGVLAVLLIMGT